MRSRRRSFPTSGLTQFGKLVKPKIKTLLRYVDTKTLSPGTGAGVHTFRMRSIYDPDYTGGGHQPMFRDNWATLYGQYKVLKTMVSVTFHPNMVTGDVVDQVQPYVGATDTYPYILTEKQRNEHILFLEVGQTAVPEYGIAANKNALREAGRVTDAIDWKYMGPKDDKGLVMSKVINGKRWVSDPEYMDESTLIGVNSDTKGEVYLHVGCMSKDGNDTNKVKFDIHLSFIVELSDPVASAIVEN